MRALLRILLHLAPLVALLAGCDPFQFDDFEDTGGVRVLERPDGYRRGEQFPAVLATFEGDSSGTEVSRLAVSAGADSPVLSYAGWAGESIGPPEHLVVLCEDAGDCAEGAGTALAGFPVWRDGMAAQANLCILITAPDSGVLGVQCESSGGLVERFTGPIGIDFGRSAAALGARDVGVAVIGAPGGMSGQGELYRLPDGTMPVAIATPVGVVTSTGELGMEVAAVGLTMGSTRIVAAAPGDKRVLVFDLFADASVQMRGCLDGTPDGYGLALAVGHLDTDPEPDVVVGSADPGGSDAPVPVEVWRGSAAAVASMMCEPWRTAGADLVTCPDALRDVDCASSGFGRSVAIGDVNGDGVGDLIVGAPFADVDGKNDAGAVYVFTGPDFAETDVLTHSSPEANDRLGERVAAVATNIGPGRTVRHEPVATSNGRKATLIFQCSGLAGDGPDAGTQCIPPD